MSGELPSTFTLEEDGEQYMIGSEVGNYLRLTRGALYKKYPSLTRRNLTKVERSKLVEMGLPQVVTAGSSQILLLASEVEDILEGRDELLKSDKTSKDAPAALAGPPKPASIAIVPFLPNSSNVARPTSKRKSIVTNATSDDEIKDIDNCLKKKRKCGESDDDYNPVENDGKKSKLKVRSNLCTFTAVEKVRGKSLSELDIQIRDLEKEEKAGRLGDYEQLRLYNMRARRGRAQELELVERPTNDETSNTEPPIQQVVEVATAENGEDGHSPLSIKEVIGGHDPLTIEEKTGVSPPHSTPEVG